MIIIYQKRMEQRGKRRSCRAASRMKDGASCDRDRSHERSYEVPSPPPHPLFSPREIGSGDQTRRDTRNSSRGRTLASGDHPEEGLARRRSPSSPPSTRGLQHHHHCLHHHHHPHPYHCNTRNPSGSFRVLFV